MKKLLLLGGIVLLGFTACKKDEDQVKTENNLTTTSTANLEVPKDFDWKTTKLTTLRVEASDVPFSQKMKMEVRTVDGRLILTRHISMMEDADIQFELPLAYEQIVVEYGALTKTVDVNNGLASFDFIPVEDEVNTNNDSENPQPEEELIKVED